MSEKQLHPYGKAQPRLRAIYATIREDDIARAVEGTYDLGEVDTCHLIRRGFNDVYELSLRDGRLRRPRGPAKG